jgi:hypothetical protein
MFICEPCLDKYEGLAVEMAKALILFTGSFGPCEVCRKASNCADVPSSANFSLKKEKDG